MLHVICRAAMPRFHEPAGGGGGKRVRCCVCLEVINSLRCPFGRHPVRPVSACTAASSLDTGIKHLGGNPGHQFRGVVTLMSVPPPVQVPL